MDDQNVLGPCTLRMTKSRNCSIISQYLHLPLCTFSIAVSVCLSLKKKAFFLVPQVLINSIYDAFIASKGPSMKVSFQIWEKVDEGAKSGEYGEGGRTSELHLVRAAIAT